MSRPRTRLITPWQETLGCEVNVCQAQHCDAQRMEICALRIAWLEMRDALLDRMERARTARGRAIYRERLAGMGVKLSGKGEDDDQA
jgi:hypothetical protein